MPRSYSLALGWWAARGLVHLGVYRYLRERNIEIREVAGTSMGAIIAAFIASGKSDEETIAFARSISYYRLVDADLSQGFLKGKKIVSLLEGVFGNQEIQDTPIPLRIVATNIDEWTAKIFTQWKIVDALRASFSIPWIFSPKIIDDMRYVDGWMVMNLPIQALDGDDIIAVSALKMPSGHAKKKRNVLGFSVKPGFFTNNFEILNRSFSLLMKTNEDVSLSIVGKNVRLVRPHFAKLDALDFQKVDEFVALGYESAKQAGI